MKTALFVTVLCLAALLPSTKGDDCSSAMTPVFAGLPLGPWDENTCNPVTITATPGQTLFLGVDTKGLNSHCEIHQDSLCSDTPITDLTPSSGSTVVYVKCSMSYFVYLTVGTACTVTDVRSNAFSVRGLTGAGMCGDPHVFGWDSRDAGFFYNGQIGTVYNAFSNEHVIVNTKFISANQNGGPAGELTTVIGAIGVRTKEFALNFDTSIFDGESGLTAVTVNDVVFALEPFSESSLLGDCYNVNYNWDMGRHHKFTFSIHTPVFDIWIYYSEDHTNYIDTKYLDFYLVADTTSSYVGGILGAIVDPNYDRAAVAAMDFSIAGTTNVLARPTGEHADTFAATPSCGTGKRVPPTCRNMPHGHKCSHSFHCASSKCNFDQHACVPKDTCLSDAACTSPEVCDFASATCKVPQV